MKNSIVNKRHRDSEWEDHEVIEGNPMKGAKWKDFITETEGTENKGGDPRLIKPIRHTMSKRDFQRQQAAMKRLRERGWPNEV